MGFNPHCIMVSKLVLRASAVVLALLLTVTGLNAQSTLDVQRVPIAANFRASARLVLVPLTVTDNYGKTITGLRAQDFNLFDDQVRQPIVSFSSEDTACSVGLVLDTSGSMRSALSIAKDGAQTLVQTANPNDEFLLLTVSTQPAAGPEFTTDAADFARTVAFTQPGAGMTALIDTVYLGLNQMRKAQRPQRALVVLSDGMDNHSRYSKSQLLAVALEADVQIYTIIMDGLGGGSSTGGVPFRPSMIAKPGDRGPQQEGPALLENLADKTGGLHFHAHTAIQAKEAMAKVGEALRNQYVIGYQPADSGTSGKLHRIHVTTTVPKVYVHARTGYYAP
jgi:Ca-activated chloride channel family protein